MVHERQGHRLNLDAVLVFFLQIRRYPLVKFFSALTTAFYPEPVPCFCNDYFVVKAVLFYHIIRLFKVCALAFRAFVRDMLHIGVDFGVRKSFQLLLGISELTADFLARLFAAVGYHLFLVYRRTACGKPAVRPVNIQKSLQSLNLFCQVDNQHIFCGILLCQFLSLLL